jgi:hypothetical protein
VQDLVFRGVVGVHLARDGPLADHYAGSTAKARKKPPPADEEILTLRDLFGRNVSGWAAATTTSTSSRSRRCSPATSSTRRRRAPPRRRRFASPG